MNKVKLTKDEMRVQRSIESITRKLEVALAKSYPLLVESEKRFEQSCLDAGIIYFPR